MGKRRNQVVDARTHYETQQAVSRYSQAVGLLYKEKVAFTHIPPQSKILDLGCGTGRTTVILAKDGHEVIGVDIAEAMVAAARSQASAIPYVAGDACALSFRDSRFDVIVFSASGIDLIHPYEKRLDALREIRRVLKPAGLFIFGVHNHCIPRDLRGLGPFLKSLFRRNRNGYVDDFHDSWGGTKIYLSTPQIQTEELRDVGFDLIELVQRRILRRLQSRRLLGLIDEWCCYVCRSSKR